MSVSIDESEGGRVSGGEQPAHQGSLIHYMISEHARYAVHCLYRAPWSTYSTSCGRWRYDNYYCTLSLTYAAQLRYNWYCTRQNLVYPKLCNACNLHVTRACYVFLLLSCSACLTFSISCLSCSGIESLCEAIAVKIPPYVLELCIYIPINMFSESHGSGKQKV